MSETNLTHISATINIPLSRIADLLITAFEGGSNYWYVINSMTKPELLSFRFDEERVIPSCDYPLNEGGCLMIGDIEDAEVESKILNLATVTTGIELLATTYPKDFSAILTGDEDASTADVFLQLCLFGKIVYS